MEKLNDDLGIQNRYVNIEKGGENAFKLTEKYV